MAETIIAELGVAAVEISERVRDGEHEAALEHMQRDLEYRAWRKQEQERRQAQALAESKAHLLTLAREWEDARRVEAFLRAVERSAADSAELDRDAIVKRLALARSVILEADPVAQFRRWTGTGGERMRQSAESGPR